MSAVFPNFDASSLTAESLQAELLIKAILLGVRTAIPVEVMAVHPGTGTPPSNGTVDVKPLVQTVDGNGTLWPIQTVYGAPFCRYQSGGNAVINDPKIGDVGLAAINDRDISSVIASGGKASGPGSSRRHHISDLIYVMSIISAATLTQYIWFAAGINIQSPVVSTSGNVAVGTGATGTFTDLTGQVVTVQNGIIINIE